MWLYVRLCGRVHYRHCNFTRTRGVLRWYGASRSRTGTPSTQTITTEKHKQQTDNKQATNNDNEHHGDGVP